MQQKLQPAPTPQKTPDIENSKKVEFDEWPKVPKNENAASAIKNAQNAGPNKNAEFLDLAEQLRRSSADPAHAAHLMQTRAQNNGLFQRFFLDVAQTIGLRSAGELPKVQPQPEPAAEIAPTSVLRTALRQSDREFRSLMLDDKLRLQGEGVTMLRKLHLLNGLPLLKEGVPLYPPTPTSPWDSEPEKAYPVEKSKPLKP